MEVRDLDPADAVACDGIILGLPYHFALEDGREECARAVRNEPGLVAMEGDAIIGFLTFAYRYDDTAELTWMAVRADRRRTGAGSRLIDALVERLRADGRKILAVLTVSPMEPGEEPADGYQTTRAFYVKNGFSFVRDLPGLWDEDLAVMLVRFIDGPTILSA
jgi:GNAT superfamily N-acetyltransferase